MANGGYNIAAKKMIDGNFNWASLDVRLLLVDSGYTYDKDHDFVADVAANELSGTGYARKTLTGEATSQDDVNNRAEGDANDPTWTAINAGTAAAAILFAFVTNDADSWLIAHIDTGGFPITTNGGDLTIQFNAEGVIQVVP